MKNAITKSLMISLMVVIGLMSSFTSFAQKNHPQFGRPFGNSQQYHRVKCVAVGTTLTILIEGSDHNSGSQYHATVTLTATKVPSGVSFYPSLPASAVDYVSTTLSWTPTTTGSDTVDLKLTESNGNSVTKHLIICAVSSGSDVTAPTIICSSDVSVNSDAGQCYATVTLTAPSASDNVGVTSLTNDAPSTFPNGATTVTWTASDAAGNQSTCTQVVTVSDIEAPSITCNGNVSVNNDAGACGATVNLGTPSTGDNCGVASVDNDYSSNSFQVGTTTVTWTVTDIHGNTNTCTQTVTVSDNEAPVIKSCASNMTVNADNSGCTYAGSLGSVTATDNCGIASITNDVTGALSVGANTVTWTVTDVHGNTATCTSTVTVVNPVSCTVKATPSNNVYTGGVATNLYIGYGPQSATVTANGSGGTSYTYSWSGSYLTNTTSQNATFTPTAAGTYTLTCNITNQNGCKSSCKVTFCVMDIRSAGKGNAGKVNICHVPPGNTGNPQSLSISVNAVPHHLSQHSGDRLGTCNQSCDGNKDEFTDVILEGDEDVNVEMSVSPNPFTNEFRFAYSSTTDERATINVYDITGKLVSNSQIFGYTNNMTFGLNLAAGIYTLSFTQGSITKSVRIVKAN